MPIYHCSSFARLLVATAAVALLGAGERRPLRVGVSLAPNTLDPLVSSQYIENCIEEAIFDGLTIVDDRGRLEPDLSVAVPTKANGGVSADGKTITLALQTRTGELDFVANLPLSQLSTFVNSARLTVRRVPTFGT